VVLRMDNSDFIENVAGAWIFIGLFGYMKGMVPNLLYPQGNELDIKLLI